MNEWWWMFLISTCKGFASEKSTKNVIWFAIVAIQHARERASQNVSWLRRGLRRNFDDLQLRLFKLELLELLSSNPNFRDFPKSWKKVPIFLSPAAAKPRVGWKVPICWRISSRARAAHGGEKSSYSEFVDLKAANSGQLYFILLVISIKNIVFSIFTSLALN